MKRGTPQCGKMYDLAQRLKIHRMMAVGMMECLWHAAARHTPHGNLGRYPDSWIADQMSWKGTPSLLVEALVSSGWLDVHEKHRLLLHDWPEHCESSVHQLLKKKKELFADGSAPFARNSYPSHTPEPESVHEPEVNHSRPPSEGKARQGKASIPENNSSSEPEALSDPSWESEIQSAVDSVVSLIRDRHPKRRRDIGEKTIEKHLLAAVRRKKLYSDSKANQAVFFLWALCNRHERMCGSAQWLKEDGEFAKGLNNWLGSPKEFYEEEPPPESGVRPRDGPKDKKARARAEFDERMQLELTRRGTQLNA